MKYDNQIRYAKEIISTFAGGIPLHDWLKQFFREHKQMGSKDRKQLSEMVYCFYRLGHAAKNVSTDDRILLGLFLCNSVPVELLGYFKSAWNNQIHLSPEEKLNILSQSSLSFQLTDIFPWKDQLGEGIDHAALCKSFFYQPDVFLRVRPGYEQTVLTKLQAQPRSFEWIAPATVRLPNGFKVDQLFELNKEVVIQDLNSQQTGGFFLPTTDAKPGPVKAWDCCAASGGKSILLWDQYQDLQLLVSDIRPAILDNLQKRFIQAGIHQYESLVMDLAKPHFKFDAAIFTRATPFDLLILDAPCTGSGTWARNPDELYFFDLAAIDRFGELQRRIVSNTIFSLNKKGRLVYITCSVFKKENEMVVDYIRKTYRLNLERMEYFTGYGLRADSMFAASFSS
jgi:16S rRNA (cytosine967-C5)-methyltransferase